MTVTALEAPGCSSSSRRATTSVAGVKPGPGHADRWEVTTAAEGTWPWPVEGQGQAATPPAWGGRVPPHVPGLQPHGLLGSGGAGTVWKCWQAQFERWVAVKVLDVDPTHATAQLFAKECRAMGRVCHPRVLPVHAAAVDGTGRPYLVMPWAARGSAADLLRADGPLSLVHALSITAKVAQGLQAAHDAGVLHRDVKPENVLIMESGEPALSDFGISRLADTAVTVTRRVRLTVEHAAPEVVSGERATTASDVYSLASTAYRLLTARWPHQGRPDEPEAALVLRTVTQDPPGLERFGVPRPVADVVARGMHRDPSARWPSPLVLGHELAAAGLGVVEPDPPPDPLLRDTRLLDVPWQQPTSVMTAVLPAPGPAGAPRGRPVVARRLLTADDVRRCRFPVAFRGYDVSQVDAFLDRVADDLARRARGGRAQGALTAAVVRDQQFRVGFRGYGLDAVDALLDQVEATLRELDASA